MIVCGSYYIERNKFEYAKKQYFFSALNSLLHFSLGERFVYMYIFFIGVCFTCFYLYNQCRSPFPFNNIIYSLSLSLLRFFLSTSFSISSALNSSHCIFQTFFSCSSSSLLSLSLCLLPIFIHLLFFFNLLEVRVLPSRSSQVRFPMVT